jgi:hypothetical protein
MDPVPHRAVRIARVLVSLATAELDAHSVDDLCRRSDVGVSRAAFRRWCADEGISAGSALTFARLLRALVLAREHGVSPLEWLDCDARSFRRALRVGGVRDLFVDGLPTVATYLSRQQLIHNDLVLAEVRSSLEALSLPGLAD